MARAEQFDQRDPVPVEAVVAVLEVLLPPQPESAIATTTVPTATGPPLIAHSLACRGLGETCQPWAKRFIVVNWPELRIPG